MTSKVLLAPAAGEPEVMPVRGCSLHLQTLLPVTYLIQEMVVRLGLRGGARSRLPPESY
jgi:hypothetical protein